MAGVLSWLPMWLGQWYALPVWYLACGLAASPCWLWRSRTEHLAAWPGGVARELIVAAYREWRPTSNLSP